MNIERIELARLKSDPRNARKHPERNLDSIKSALREFGQQKPIVIDAKNVVIAGNGTLAAAKALGWKSLDCVRSQLKGHRRTAYAIADNRTAELAEWDDSVLAASLQEMAGDVKLEDIGFDEQELRELLEVDDEPDDDDEGDDDDVQPVTSGENSARHDAHETKDAQGETSNDEDDSEAKNEAPKPTASGSPQRTFSLPILLDRQQYESWQKRKAELQEKNDTRAFLKAANL
jgi:ParB-like chromosome segregation protein Spo0J